MVGTSSRRVAVSGGCPPRRSRARRSRAPEGRTAIVFGDERSGLTNEEVHRCHDLSAIPTDEAQPSVNLAQAVLLYAYELRRAVLEAGAQPATPAPAAGATDAELGELEEALRTALRASGFLAGPERHAVRDLVAPLSARLTPRGEAVDGGAPDDGEGRLGYAHSPGTCPHALERLADAPERLPPTPSTTIDAAAAPRRAASTGSSPRASANRNPAANTSPAPVGSTSRAGNTPPARGGRR